MITVLYSYTRILCCRYSLRHAGARSATDPLRHPRLQVGLPDTSMSSAVSSQALEHAIIQSVEHGVLPDSEQVSSAELTPSVLPALLANLQQARDEVKVWVTLSSMCSPAC